MEPHLAAKIAAGEVVDRPASVVKELVENALDAGATAIRVDVEGGGADRIVVADNGRGIPAAEVELAFRRHATSKLSREEDLDTLCTLGFRGEALPSIAAVADVACATRSATEQVGLEFRIDGGSLEERPLARQVGTTMVVERLFARFPARRKFLRSRGAEAAACVQVVQPLALAFPEVQMAVLVDGREGFRSPGDGDLRGAALAVLGRDAERHLLQVPATVLVDDSGGDAVEVSGVCSAGGYHRSSRTAIHVLVNRRPVQNRSLSFAVVEAYGSALPVGRQPVAVLDVRVPPSAVDFNVHPSKLEVKLLRERTVYAAIQRAVRAALAREEWAVASWSDGGGHAESTVSMGGERLAELRLLGQAGGTYLIAEGDAGVYLVDQHAAHERVLLEALRAGLVRRSERQLLLEPVVLDVPPEAVGVIESAAAELDHLGFDLDVFGPRQLLLRAVPGVLAARQPERVLAAALAAVGSGGHGLVVKEGASWVEQLALVLACKTAVRAGDRLSETEMLALLRQLGEAELCRTCAHGRPTAILLSHAHLERQFGRR